VVPAARPRRRGAGAAAGRHEHAQGPRRQPAAPGAPPARQGHAPPARARPRRRLLPPGPRGAGPAQRAAAGGAGSVRGRLARPPRPAAVGLPRADEEVDPVGGAVSAADYWELALPITDEASEPVTNFLWELGALGVVEEATPDGAARLRAFFPESFAAAPLERRVRDYLAELAALGIPAPAAATVAPLAGDDWAEAWRRHFRPLPVGR